MQNLIKTADAKLEGKICGWMDSIKNAKKFKYDYESSVAYTCWYGSYGFFLQH